MPACPYAGLSQNMKIFGLYNVNPVFDNNNITAHLAAQIIWYFTEGFTQRILEIPASDNTGFRKFIVKNSQVDPEMIFYKSLVTDRWWVEVPVTSRKKKKHLIVSCSAEDYQAASGEQIPERWWKLLRRLG
jgi:formiminoglutamase